MNDFSVIICYFPMVVITSILFVYTRTRMTELKGNMLSLLSIVLIWQATEILCLLSRNESFCMLLYPAYLPLKGFLSLSLMLYIFQFYGMNTYYTKNTIFILSVIPCLTLILTVIPRDYGLLFSSFVVEQTYPAHIIKTELSVYGNIHVGYCLFMEIIAFAVVIKQMSKFPKAYSRISVALLSGLALSVVGLLLSLAPHFLARFNWGLIGGSVCTLLLFAATKGNKGMDFLNRARATVFDEIEKAIFILDDDGNIVSRNLAAKYLLFKASVNPEEPKFSTVMNVMYANSTSRNVSDDDQIGVNYHFKSPNETTVFNLKDKTIYSEEKRPIGKMVVCSDVTAIHTTIQKIEKLAGLDAMTGLLNRQTMQKKQLELDTEENLPISVIVCDLNGLNNVNEAMGRQHGDAIIRAAAEALITCCPPNACLARIGGDEFLLVIPRHTINQSLHLMSEINAYLERSKNPTGKVSMAMGANAKISMKQSLSQVIWLADKQMQENKAFMRQKKIV